VTAAPKKPAPITSKGAVPKAPLRKAADHIVTFKTVFEKIAEANELSRKRGHAMAAELVDGVVAILKNGGRVRFAGLGTLEVRNRAARMGRNPATGAAIQIAASKKIGFRAAKELKAAI
jgi:DNA-binding protein HU-beta